MPDIEFKVKAYWSLSDDTGKFILCREAEIKPRFSKEDRDHIATISRQILDDYADRERTPDQWGALIHSAIDDPNMRRWVSSVIWYQFAEDDPRKEQWEVFWEEECQPLPQTDEEFPSPRLYKALNSIGISTDKETAGQLAKKALTRRKIQMKLRSRKSDV